jgi:hypothetical protein
MKIITPAGLAALLVLTAGCGSNDAGRGVGSLDREFQKPASEVWEASVKSVGSMDLCLSSDSDDHVGGDLVATSARGQEVRIRIRSLEANRSRVSVRVEPDDRTLAIKLQDRIAENLAALLGGNSIEGTYAADLGVAMLMARRTLRSLEVHITEHEPHADWARIDGRRENSTPVRIRIDRIEEQKMKVTFIAGNERSEDNQAFVQRMKEEYETRTQIKGASY